MLVHLNLITPPLQSLLSPSLQPHVKQAQECLDLEGKEEFGATDFKEGEKAKYDFNGGDKGVYKWRISRG